ncbi:SRPBCC family protein [Siccirubricoccus sp. G192]|uniref:SRPBCC family protein n=1 Tax=Siccirubricoccus sp. G192 TaxID=2849651 RepID=UPI001C2CB3B7|nr:SRPBCC family protein [Siccirubricoccus sp. G192]MBV1797194.1 SRPBCC family protein [Siccirubricoccus sp. G192]
MGDYTGRIEIGRPAQEVFASLADIRNMPRYLPSVRHVRQEGQAQDRVVMEGEADGRGWRAEGWLRMDAETRRMEWGADDPPGYRGALRVEHGPRDRSEVHLQLHLTPGPEVARRMQAHHGNVDHAMRVAMERTLGSIKACCEGAPGEAAADKDTTRSADDLPDSRPFGSSATLNPDI